MIIENGVLVKVNNEDIVNGTFEISQESLSPSTDYSFTI